MLIKSIVETSFNGMYKVETDQTKLFLRKEYLPTVDFEKMEPDAEFLGEQEDEIIDGGFAAVVELKAIEYLARAEQSRFGLTRKLLEKHFDKKYIDMALSLLEKKDYLSDIRYSRAWLNTRKINHFEGRKKLVAELLSRGISKEIALSCVDEFFTENDEREICKKAYERFLKKGKDGDKLIAAMMQAGFPYKMVSSLNE